MEIDVDQAAAYAQRVTLTQPVVFSVKVVDSSGATVWEGILPGLQQVDKGAHLVFPWNQKDANGIQVPAGNYIAELVTPLPTISYSIGNTAATETLTDTPRTMTGQHYSQLITITP